ncbi:MAG: hypothetical protein ACE10E_14725, partial [Acidiferrobacterales bacterium]
MNKSILALFSILLVSVPFNNAFPQETIQSLSESRETERVAPDSGLEFQFADVPFTDKSLSSHIYDVVLGAGTTSPLTYLSLLQLHQKRHFPLSPLFQDSQHDERKGSAVKTVLISMAGFAGAGAFLGLLLEGVENEGCAECALQGAAVGAAIGSAAGTLVGLSVVILNSESPPSPIEGGVAGGMLGLVAGAVVGAGIGTALETEAEKAVEAGEDPIAEPCLDKDC